MGTLTILGIDPGSKNMGYGVVKGRIWDGGLQFKIPEVGMFHNRVEKMNGNVRDDLKRFNRDLRSIVKRHKVDVIVAERYMNRGIRGNTGELVGIMLGAVAMCSVQDVMFIPAAQWKNALNKNTSLPGLYSDSRLVAHAVDATCIGMYGVCHYLGYKPFEFAANKKQRSLFLKSMDGADIR